MWSALLKFLENCRPLLHMWRRKTAEFFHYLCPKRKRRPCIALHTDDILAHCVKLWRQYVRGFSNSWPSKQQSNATSCDLRMWNFSHILSNVILPIHSKTFQFTVKMNFLLSYLCTLYAQQVSSTAGFVSILSLLKQ